MKYHDISPKLAISYLKGPGKVYVSAKLTEDNSYYVPVIKSELIKLFGQFSQDTRIGYVYTGDGSMIFEWRSEHHDQKTI